MVVSGVLMAVAITAFYEDYQNKKLELHYLNQMMNDMNLTVERLKKTMEVQKGSFDARIQIIQAFSKESNIRREEFFSLWALSQRKYALSVIDSTARSLISTGDINLIRDKSLRNDVITWVSGLDSIKARYLDYELLFRELGFKAGQLIDRGDYIALRMSDENEPESEDATLQAGTEKRGLWHRP